MYDLVLVKDDTHDSGIETSGEVDRSHSTSEERRQSPDSLDSSPDAAAVTATTNQPARSRDVVDVTATDGVIMSNGDSLVNGTDHHGPRRRDVKKLRNKRSSGEDSNSTAGSDSQPNGNVINTDPIVPEASASPTWSFPPVLDEFNLMESDADPSVLEDMFLDSRLIEVKFRVEPGSRGVGISIVGGVGSPRGDLPIFVKRVLQGSPVEQDGVLKAGDELVAVNETILVEVSKDFAVNALSKVDGDVRLLVLQDD